MKLRVLPALAILLPAAAASADSVPLKAHKKSVNAVAVSADGKLIASGGDEGNLIVWQQDGAGYAAGPTREIESASEHAGPILSLAFSPDGKRVASGNMYGKLVVWDHTTKKDLFPTLKAHDGNINQIRFFPDGKTFVTASISWPTATTSFGWLIRRPAPSSLMWTSPSTAGAISTNAPNDWSRVIVPFTRWPSARLAVASRHGSLASALSDRLIRSEGLPLPSWPGSILSTATSTSWPRRSTSSGRSTRA